MQQPQGNEVASILQCFLGFSASTSTLKRFTRVLDKAMDHECGFAPYVLKVSSAGFQNDGEIPPAHHTHWPRKAALRCHFRSTLALRHTKLRLFRMYPKKMHAGQRKDFTSANFQRLYKFAWIEHACRVRQPGLLQRKYDDKHIK